MTVNKHIKSSRLFYFEHELQPTKYANFRTAKRKLIFPVSSTEYVITNENMLRPIEGSKYLISGNKEIRSTI